MTENLLDNRLAKKHAAIRPNLKRAKLAKTLIWCVAGVSVLTAISSFMQYNLLSDPFSVSYEKAMANDRREIAVNMLYLAVYIVSIVMFIQWFRRAYYNLNKRVKCEHSEGWAAGYWFIPIANLFMPYQIMSEISRKNSKMLNEKNPEGSLVGIWWALWIILSLGSNILGRMFNSTDLESMANLSLLEVVTDILFIGLSVITVQMIDGQAKKEERLRLQEVEATAAAL